ncbi:hypothetical protein ACYULU_14520 [Breznakiellaceae bacterium SP9]
MINYKTKPLCKRFTSIISQRTEVAGVSLNEAALGDTLDPHFSAVCRIPALSERQVLEFPILPASFRSGSETTNEHKYALTQRSSKGSVSL